MRHDKLERELDMMLMLTGNRAFTIDQVCERLSISRRNLYYYIEFFRDCGFIVSKVNGCYSIDRDSPFFKKLLERVSFTEEEAIVLQRLVNNVDQKNAVIERLRQKLGSFYDLDILAHEEHSEQQAHIVSELHRAIKLKQMCVLRGYTSPHGKSSRDRLVEPFLLMNGNQEVRCFEPASGMNKTFKVARMANVDVLDDEWMNEDKHRQMYTDIFMFSDDTQMPVTLRMGTLATNVLKEEYPAAKPYIKADDDNHWLLQINVCSYAGIGRFVLGLFEDIEVLGDEGFRRYLNERIKKMILFTEKQTT